MLSSIFGKNPSPSPTGDASPPPAPTKSPVAKTRLGSTSKEPEPESKLAESEELAAPKRSAAPSKLGIGVGGNVLAEMKARQERRISGILKQNSEESDFSERSEKLEPSKASLSPNPLGGIRLRPTPHTPEEPEAPKLPEKNNVRFVRPTGLEEVESERNKAANPLTGFRLRHRGGTEEAEATATAKLEEKSNALNQIRLRATSTVVDDSPSPDPSGDAKAHPLSGVRLRSTGINVTDPLKSPNNGDSSAEIKNESRNSLTKLKPPPLAPKPRPWSIVGSDKKPGI